MAEFWALVKHEEWFKVNPFVAYPDLLLHLLGLVFHMDGAQVYNDQEYFFYSVSTIHTAGGGDAWDTKFPLAAFPHNAMRRRSTRDGVHERMSKVIGWSLGCAHTGVNPTEGFRREPFKEGSHRHELQGKLIMEGWRACFAGTKGDRKAMYEVHNLDRNWQATYICHKDLASQPYELAVSQFAYTNFSEDAPWRSTMLTHEMRLALFQQQSVWLRHVAGFHYELIFDDIMHDNNLGFAGKKLKTKN